MLTTHSPNFLAKRATHMLVALMAAAGLFTSDAAHAARPGPSATIELVAAFDWTFQAGFWTGFVLGPASDIGPYLVEVTPLEPSSIGGAWFTTTIQQEFNGANGTWSDVVRIQLLPSGGTPVSANVRVFRLGSR